MGNTIKHLEIEGAPSTKEFQSLYSAIGKFREEKLYQLIGSEYCFGIAQDDGTTHWCVIMGQGGQEFGASIFYGDQSLDAFYKLVEDPNCPDSFPMRTLNGTYFNLVNKSDLESVDVKELKEREFSTYGRGKGWPLVRRYLPHHTVSELVSTKDIAATEELLELLPSIISDFLEEVLQFDENNIEFPILTISKDGKRVWKQVEPQFEIETDEKISFDPFKANRVKKLPNNEKTIFIGTPLLLTPITEQNPPSLPEGMLIVDTENGMVLNFAILDFGSKYNEERISKLVEHFIEMESRPERILIENSSLMEPLEQIFASTETEIVEIAPPEAYYQMLDEMLSMMNSGY